MLEKGTGEALVCASLTSDGQVLPMPEGLRLFRGVSNVTGVPAALVRADRRGRRGCAEMGFLSTTARRGPGGRRRCLRAAGWRVALRVRVRVLCVRVCSTT